MTGENERRQHATVGPVSAPLPNGPRPTRPGCADSPHRSPRSTTSTPPSSKAWTGPFTRSATATPRPCCSHWPKPGTARGQPPHTRRSGRRHQRDRRPATNRAGDQNALIPQTARAQSALPTTSLRQHDALSKLAIPLRLEHAPPGTHAAPRVSAALASATSTGPVRSTRRAVRWTTSGRPSLALDSGSNGSRIWQPPRRGATLGWKRWLLAEDSCRDCAGGDRRRALRIRLGCYSVCHRCKTAILRDRLEALPMACLCMNCQYAKEMGCPRQIGPHAG